NVSYPVDRPYT
ncbi:hypothetical protein ACN38_g13180, partial [Penicillium nordicum]